MLTPPVSACRPHTCRSAHATSPGVQQGSPAPPHNSPTTASGGEGTQQGAQQPAAAAAEDPAGGRYCAGVAPPPIRLCPWVGWRRRRLPWSRSKRAWGKWRPLSAPCQRAPSARSCPISLPGLYWAGSCAELAPTRPTLVGPPLQTSQRLQASPSQPRGLEIMAPKRVKKTKVGHARAAALHSCRLPPTQQLAWAVASLQRPTRHAHTAAWPACSLMHHPRANQPHRHGPARTPAPPHCAAGQGLQSNLLLPVHGGAHPHLAD